MSKSRFHVKKGDNVQVITGNHKGAIGKILQVFPTKQQVLGTRYGQPFGTSPNRMPVGVRSLQLG